MRPNTVNMTINPGFDGLAAPSTALLTDHYELTALDAALRSGVASHRAVFEVFGRRLPKGRRYGVVAGIGRAIDAIERFRFDDAELTFLAERKVLSEAGLAFLADFRFSGEIASYRDGELYFPYSPILTVEAPFGEALLLETVLLSILNHDCAIASAAARMKSAANGRSLIEAGTRRTHEAAAVAAALSAYIAGFDVTSNLEAGRRYGLPTAGTTMHAFTLAHRSEVEAFRAQVERFGSDTTFLVDTYDIAQGIRNAVDAAGHTIKAIRIDSGDLEVEAGKARLLLDELGALDCDIVVSSDLDEFAIEKLHDDPVDKYMVGTKLVTGSGAPTASLVYKLVGIADGPGADEPIRPVAKNSEGKGHRGGRKRAIRLLRDGVAVAELVETPQEHNTVPSEFTQRPLQVTWIEHGDVIESFSPHAAREHHRTAIAELPAEALALADGDTYLHGELGVPPISD